MKQKLIITFLILLVQTPFLFAQQINDQQPTTAVVLCPSNNALKKDPTTMTWAATNGWKSYSLSFVEKIAHFLGAQWNGVNVGQITCIYSGAEAHDFPVLLIFHTLTLEPAGNSWSKNLGGFRNCNANDQKQCPFQMRLRPKRENANQELQSLKPSNPPQEPGF